jgi:hypothetical protein
MKISLLEPQIIPPVPIHIVRAGEKNNKEFLFHLSVSGGVLLVPLQAGIFWFWRMSETRFGNSSQKKGVPFKNRLLNHLID